VSLPGDAGALVKRHSPRSVTSLHARRVSRCLPLRDRC